MIWCKSAQTHPYHLLQCGGVCVKGERVDYFRLFRIVTFSNLCANVKPSFVAESRRLVWGLLDESLLSVEYRFGLNNVQSLE